MILLEEWKAKVQGLHNEFHYWFAPKEDCSCSMLAEYDEDRYKVGEVYEGYSKNGGYVISACGENQLYDFYEDAFFPAEDCYWSKKEAQMNASLHKNAELTRMASVTFPYSAVGPRWRQEEE